MSEDNSADTGESTGSDNQDPIKNLKSEIDRKLGNTEASIAELHKQNQALIDQISKMAQSATASKPVSKESEVSLSDLIYDDPEKAIAIIEQRTEERIRKSLNEDKQAQYKTTEVLNKLVSEFPELGDTNTDLYKKAIEIYNSMDAEDKTSPSAYKSAVYAAAVDVGVKPKSKRTSDDSQDFTLGSGGTGSSKSAKKSSKVENGILESAKLMGLNVDDPKVVERLKSRSERKNWLKYE